MPPGWLLAQGRLNLFFFAEGLLVGPLCAPSASTHGRCMAKVLECWGNSLLAAVEDVGFVHFRCIGCIGR